MIKQKAFPFVVEATGNTESEAWAAWKKECSRKFSMVGGKKVWRTIPKISKIGTYNPATYKVKARAMTFDDIGMIPEAKPEGPYLCTFNDHESYVSSTTSCDKAS